MHQWVGDDGYPCSFSEGFVGAALVKAIQNLPNGDKLNDEDIQRKAHLFYSMACDGHDEELPRNRPASCEASGREIEKLVVLAEKLVTHIESMRAPAITALYRNNVAVFEITALLEKLLSERPSCFIDDVDSKDSSSGAPPKVAAGAVADYAAYVFEKVTGQRPTFTTNPQTSKVSGQWPTFLSAVFAALGIEASVAAQVRQVSEKTKGKTGH